MRKTDISKYTDENGASGSVSASSVAKRIFSIIGKFLLTGLMVIIITGIVIGVSLIFYIIDISNEPLNIDLHKTKLNLTSFIYVQNDKDEWEEYQQLYSSENRVWVDYQDIPKIMIDAQVAIEDKRFWDHSGVDWYRTTGAVLSLVSGKAEYGGSTITQQLIKNITDDNEVSITRKLREIFRALKLEKEYTKDEIIEAYLNIVNFGSGCRGVQSAANLYFNKDIQDCTIAECAAIAGITQNPAAYDPLVYPENNKERRETVIQAMYDQEKISKEQYDEAMKESANMKFIGFVMEEDDDDQSEWNWYIDRLFRDVVHGLEKELNIGIDYAEDKIYKEGLKIYCAMDKNAQEIAEKKVREWETPTDKTIQVGYMMMDLEGRILATVGGRQEKDGRLLWDNATQSVLQPGSTIKPVSSYVLAIEDKKLNYSSMVSDTPTSDWGYVDGNIVSGPHNWYEQYYGNITVTRALNISSNAATVNVLKMVGLDRSYEFLTEKLNFKNLDPEQDKKNLSGLSIGGFYGGATVQEMTASYQMFCNGGYYYEPYTYYYVTDNDGNVILDNRDRGKPDQVISSETATIMNRLLYDVVNSGGEALGYRAKIDGWDIIGKTGTTDSSCDNWFVGASPYAVAGIWTGHSTSSPIAIDEQSKCGYLWRDIMKEWLKNKESKSFTLSPDVEQHNFYKSSGLLTNNPVGENIGTGYYTSDNMPTYFKPTYNKPSNNNNTDNSNSDESSENSENTESSDESYVSDDTSSEISTESTESEEITEVTDIPSEQESSETEIPEPSAEDEPGSEESESVITQESAAETSAAA
ncbi:MAG: transglycosylase domain-containing protein [Clostridia bacterium]|nr:transglycosylase domain-containing protein [Clostridia bacterium]